MNLPENIIALAQKAKSIDKMYESSITPRPHPGGLNRAAPVEHSIAIADAYDLACRALIDAVLESK